MATQDFSYACFKIQKDIYNGLVPPTQLNSSNLDQMIKGSAFTLFDSTQHI
jgi:hypothetical protein